MICVPVFGNNDQDILQKIKKSSADIIEFRADKSSEFSLKKIISSCKKPIIVTNRKREEGGDFRGNESGRIKLLEDAIDFGADYIDVENSSYSSLKKRGKTKIIVSYHNFSGSSDLEKNYNEMKNKGDMLKIVGTAKSLSDNLMAFRLLERAQRDGKKLISFCMGEKGEISRILCMKYGASLTFAKEGEGTAPGQIDAGIMKKVFRVNSISKNTKVYGLVGNPVAKSKGYLIHNAAFRAQKLNCVYVNFLVEDVAKFMSDFNGFYAGLSVTMPHKQEIMKYLDDVEETARQIGAVNTVVVENGRNIGYNTDWIGAVSAIEKKTPIEGRDVLMIGCGGAGRAIAFGIKRKKGLLTVADTDMQKAVSLSADVGCGRILPEDSADFDADILINATPIGMHPKVEETPFDKGVFRKGMVVFDAVYNPMRTKMLGEAEKAGCRIISGVEMFINQGIAQYEMWAKKKAPAKIMRRIVLDSLK